MPYVMAGMLVSVEVLFGVLLKLVVKNRQVSRYSAIIYFVVLSVLVAYMLFMIFRPDF